MEGAALLRLKDEGQWAAEGDIRIAGPFGDEPVLAWDVAVGVASFSSRHVC